MTGHRFGPYELQELIGVGGMGEVWRAHDTRRERSVALKLLPESLGQDPEFRARFRRESHVAARLREPHVIPIHDYGEIDGRLFIDMRLVDGRDLGEILKDGPLPPDRAVFLLSQVADALEAAHADSLVHRDVKPSNVLVTANDFVYVVDFGIARSIGSTRTSLTITGATVGTLDYMAPERFTNQPLDGRVDVYSLACVFSECLTATRPFRGEDLPALLYAHLYTEPPRPSEVVPSIPVGLDEVVRKGMAKKPEDRYSTPCELMSAARRALTRDTPGHLVAGAPAPRPAPETVRTAGPDPRAGAQPMLGGPLHTAAHGAGVVSASGMHRSVEQLPPPAGPTGPSQLPAPDWERRDGRGRGRRPALLAGLLALLLVAGLVTYLLWPEGNGAAVGSSAGDTAEGTSTSESRSPTATSQRPPPPAPVPSVAVPTAAREPIPVAPTPGYLAVAPNGRYAYIAHRAEGIVSVLDTTSLQVNAEIPIDAGPPQFIAFSPDGSRAYVTVYNADYTENFVVFIDTATNEPTATVPVGKRPTVPETSPDGRLLYIPLHDEARVQVLDTESAREVDSYDVPRNPHWIALNDTGAVAYTANHESGLLSVLDLTDGGRVVREIPAGVAPHSVALSPDGLRVAVVAFESSDVHVVDTLTNAVVAVGPVGARPQDIAWAPDGRRFYTADVDGDTMSVVTADSLEVTARVPVGSPTSVGLSPDGSRAYVTDLEGARVHVFDLTG